MLDPAVNPDSGFTIGENVASRFTLAYAPRHAFSGSADYTFLRRGNMKAVAHANYQWKDQAFASSPAGVAIVGRHSGPFPPMARWMLA
jgi:iron complex outermembrane receptor protein